MKSFEALEQQINDLVQQRYLLSGRTFQPLFPWVFVRVLPKEQMLGSIYTPGKQNKPVHEGIVIAVWEQDLDRVSELSVGDHVLFPHWAGVPIEGFPAEDHAGYRVVKECAWAIDKEGGIFAKVEHQENAVVKQKLIDSAGRWPVSTVNVEQLIEILQKQYTLIPRDIGSITLSGK